MSEPTKAVFLSYASQDAEAARRICESLRSGGVEVWFDADGGLEHGDEWDAKIRRQIKECVLFIAVISANTQAREEGYFRLEWDLAAERARTIASGVPFILPVVVDETREPDALVPDRFRMVQWTKLPGGVVTPEVKARYLKLWSHRTGLLKQSELEPGRPRPGERGEGAASPVQAKVGRRVPAPAWITVAVVALGITGFVALRPTPNAGAGTHPPALSPPAVSQSNPSNRPTAEKSAAPTAPALSKRYAASRPDVATLLTRVQAMTDKTDVARAELETALSLLDQAAKLDSADANVWAERALVEERYVTEVLDTTPARKDAALQHAKQAISLDPKNPNARLADALMQWNVATNKAGRDAADAIFESLVAENSDRFEAFFFLALAKIRNRQTDEAFAVLDRAARLPGAAGRATFQKAVSYGSIGEWGKANETLDQALALERSAGALLWKSYIATFWLGDIALAKQAIAGLPAGMLTEDFPASGKLFVELWAREWDAAIATMRAIPRNYLGSGALSGPTGYYIGYALDRAGRKNAAEIEWRSALEVVNKRLESDSRNLTLFTMKALLLTALGDRPGGEKVLQTLRELYPTAWARSWAGHVLAMTLLPPEEAIAQLANNGAVGSQSGMPGSLKLDPFIDHLRSHPKFAEVLAKAESNPKLNPAAARSATGGTATENRPTAGASASTPDLKSAQADKSVAVLPFANQSADKDNEYFSDGIADELLTVLQKIPGLRVAARTSAWSFKGKNPTAQEVGEKLGMAHVVEGSVQKIGSRVKITARLSRAATNEEVWSKSFGPLEPTDVFATQSEIAQAIVGELRGRLTGEAATAKKAEIAAQVQSATKGGTKSAAAHEAYLQGMFFLRQPSPENLGKAIASFGRATEVDESFALAWAAMARATVQLASNADLTLDELTARFSRARQAADRALAVEPHLAEGHLARSMIQLRHDFDWRGARESLRQASALAPGDALVIYSTGRVARTFGDLRQALASTRQALSLDPLNLEARGLLASCYAYSGQLKEAEMEQRRILELSPSNIATRAYLAEFLVLQGRLDEAVLEATQEKAEWGRLDALALAYWAQKRPEQSDAALARLVQIASDTAAYQIAHIHAFRGDRDAAFQWLDRAYRKGDSGINLLRTDPFLANIRTDPRWPEFLKKVGLHDDQLK